MTFSLFAGLTACFALSSSAQSPILPSQDPFYSQPANISAYNPGAVIRHRSVGTEIDGLFGLNVTVASATQFMYRTTDSFDESVAAVMTVLVPNSNANSSSLLAYSVAYDSANIDCSPSYTLRPSPSNNDAVGVDAISIQAALIEGWYIVTSDYEGLQAEFVAGIMSGHGVLDSIRASLNESATAITGLSPTAQYAMFGYSGGSLAAEWATELAPAYAPDLTRFIGTAIGGLEPNITNVLLTTTGTDAAYLDFAGTLGLSKAYANLSSYIDQQLISSKTAEFYNIASGCGQNQIVSGLFQDYFSYFASGDDIIQSDVFRAVLSGAGQMGVHGVPMVPLYVYKAIGDEVSPVADTDELVQKYCQKGVVVEYTRNTFGQHISEAFLGTPAAFDWLRDRFEGLPVDQQDSFFSCEIRNVTIIEIDDSGAEQAFGPVLTGEMQKAYNNSATYG